MPRPKTKTELLNLSEQNFNKLFDFLESFSESDQQREFPQGTMNRNIRDVLAHLHQWHLMMLDWYDVGMAGNKPDMPAKGYTWKDTSVLNRTIWDHYSRTELNEVKTLLRDSFSKVYALIKSHTNEELFEKKRYKWTGSTSLGSYLVSCTSSHYDWALKLIKKAMK
tara:strand:- start:664 stop:1161 length:498 start_codon:yes stop_codon:yes gene_type:complete